MMHGFPFMMLTGAVVLVVFGMLIVAAIVYFTRPAPKERLEVSHLARGSRSLLGSALRRFDRAGTHGPDDTVEMHDTVFILPDISNYTKFMAGNHFAFGHAQHVIFSLIGAMIEAAKATVELSKLEGDAALFYADADRLSGEAVGETVMAIFRTFFQERERLIKANLCPCHACQHIGDLDLKMFVHRGNTARFKFRGSVDHFGTDVIVLHRIMKNSVKGQRYVMVTDAAADSIQLPPNLETDGVEEEVDDIGLVRATVYKIDDETAAEWSASGLQHAPSRLSETARKLRENVRSVASSFQR